MKKKVDYLAATAMAMATAAQNPEIAKEMEEEKEAKKIIVCGNCVNCPQYPKTFCKTGKRQATAVSPALNCKHFEQKEA